MVKKIELTWKQIHIIIESIANVSHGGTFTS